MKNIPFWHQLSMGIAITFFVWLIIYLIIGWMGVLDLTDFEHVATTSALAATCAAGIGFTFSNKGRMDR